MQATAHIDFILAAYAAGIIVIGALIAWVTLDYRAQRRTLAELELQGLTRAAGSARGAQSTDAAKEAAKEQA
jgi:heme exporter protein D